MDSPVYHAMAILDHMAASRNGFPKRTGLQVYKPKPSDVIVTTFPKAGTTLMQQLVYQVTVATGGAPTDDPGGSNFTDICEKVPWVNYISHVTIEPDSVPSPRLYKTHSPANRFDLSTQKHVVVLRNPEQFAGSWLDFTFACFRGPLVDNADEEARRYVFDDLVARTVLGLLPPTADETDAYNCRVIQEEGVLGAWFVHTKSWVDVLNHPNILLMFYEDIVNDMEGTAVKIANHMGRTLTTDGLNTVVSRCTREYMTKDNRFKSIWDGKVLGVDERSSKVMDQTRDGFNKFKLNEEHKKELHRQMLQAFGCGSYTELKAAVTRKQDELHRKCF